MSSRRKTSLIGGQDASTCEDWGHLFHSVLDRVKAKMAEHEVAVLLQCGRLVNRHWCRWATGATTHLTLEAGQHFEEKIKGVAKTFFGLKHIVLKGWEPVDLSPLWQAPQLRCLEIEGDFHNTELGLFTNLVSLKLSTRAISFPFPLRIKEHPHVTHQGLKMLGSLTRLERLTVPGCEMSGDECVASLARLPALTELNIECVAVSDVGIKDLAAMPRLLKCALYLPFPAARKVEVWKGLGAMTNLLELRVRSRASNGVCFPSGLVAHLSTLTKLNNLMVPREILHGNLQVSQADFQALTCLSAISHLSCELQSMCMEGSLKALQQFPRLSSLDVDCQGTVPAAKWIGALAGLVDLTFYGNGSGIDCLANLTAMTSLSLYPNCQLTDAHLSFLSSLTALKKLSLGSGSIVSSAVARSLSVLTNLTDLEAGDGDKMTDSVVENFSTLSSLTKLSLLNCPISDAGMAKLAGLTELAVLELKNCENITNVGVLQLAPLRYLRRLDLWDCMGVEMDTTAFLQKWS